MASPRLHFDLSSVITAVHSVEEARALPRGSIVGDSRGGVTFCDAVASILEQRSACGWTDIDTSEGAQHDASGRSRWTVIYLNR